MRHIHVMIADQNESYRREIKHGFEGKPHVCVVAEAGNGIEALEKLRGTSPDVVLMTLEMPALDGLGVLRKLRSMPFHPKVIVQSAVYSDDAIRLAMNLGAAYFIAKPSMIDVLYERVLDVVSFETEVFHGMEAPEERHSVEPSFDDVLLRQGIPSNIKGYEYLKCAMRLVCEDRSYLNQMSKRLYPEIAKRLGTKPFCVERNIRHAILIGAMRQDSEENATCGGRMSNREMLVRLTECSLTGRRM